MHTRTREKAQPLGIPFTAGFVAISFFFRLSVSRSQFILAVANLCHPLFSVSLPSLPFTSFFFCVCVAYMRLVLTPLMRCVAYFRGCFLLLYFVCVCCCFFFVFGHGHCIAVAASRAHWYRGPAYLA